MIILVRFIKANKHKQKLVTITGSKNPGRKDSAFGKINKFSLLLVRSCLSELTKLDPVSEAVTNLVCESGNYIYSL